MSSKKGALIITHLQPEGSCTLGQTIVKRGMRIRTINAPRHGLDDIEALRPDLMVIMGGPVGVYQADDYPFLNQEIELVKKRLDANLPTIGICLGSQIMAAAAGAEVFKGENREVGWQKLNITQDGKGTIAEHLCGSKTNMFHWHGDTFDKPSGAKVLASTAQYKNQIYTIGNSLGLQCHPEVQERQLQEWFVMFQGDVTGQNPLIPVQDLRKQTSKNIQTLNGQAEKFFNDWLKEMEF
ncbi:MAG: glutamine amidotransferase [Bdellovibrionales bacterium]